MNKNKLLKKEKKTSYLKTFLIIALMCLISLILRYQGFGAADMNEYMPLVYHTESGMFKNDLMVNSSAEFNVRQTFIFLLIFLKSLIGNYEIAALSLLFVCMLLFSWGFYKLVFLLTKNYKLSLLSLIFPLFIFIVGIGGHALEIGALLASSRIALIFVVWAIYFYFKEDYLIGFSLLGISSLFHISYAYLGYYLMFLALVFKKSENKEKLKKKIKGLLKSLSFFLFFSISFLPLLFISSKQSRGISSEKLIYIFKFRSPWHVDVLSWNWPVWAWSIFLFVLFIIAYKYSKIDRKYKNIAKIFVITMLISYVMQVIFTEFLPWGPIVKIHFFRLTEFLNLIEFIFISEFLYNSFDKKVSGNNKRVLFLLIGLLIMINLFLIMSLMLPYLFAKLTSRIPIAITLLILIPLFFIKGKKIKIILASILIIFLISYLIYNPLVGRYKYDSNKEELFEFIKKYTPEDSILLAPPYINTFRVGSERAIVVDFELAPPGDKAIVEWYNRILDVTESQNMAYKKGISFGYIKEGYKLLTEEDINGLKEKYYFDYAVFEKPKTLDFEKVYENYQFVVYKI